MLKTLLRKIALRKKETEKWAKGSPEIRKASSAIDSSSLKTTKRRCPNNFCAFVYDKGDTKELELHFEENHPLDTEERARRAGF
ncbi:MAG: hypothetical protein NUV64_03505 [Parcubacteria group bacterium]|nr:hypothetical protein [Parcubacteria group bacterium]MCR4342347.1 hypothetical protein [Patescibacteria group bacterium]